MKKKYSTKKDRTSSILYASVNLVYPSQYKDKNYYYQSFKTWLGYQPGAKPRSQAGLTINPGQYKNKNSYNYSFKTRLGSRLKARLGSRVGLVIDLG
jgi:hypothetical protein